MSPSTLRRLAFGACASALFLAPQEGAAQPAEAGINVPPVAMILFDTSSSMEWLDDGPDHTFPTCAGDGSFSPGGSSERTRLHAAIEVLTGDVPNGYCATDNRDANPLRIDQIDPSRPQGIPHSRLCSAGSLFANHGADCLPADPAVSAAGFPQINNGLLDEFDNIAFGFMAFDSFPEPESCGNGMYSYGIGRSIPSFGGVPAPPPEPENVATCGVGQPNCWNLGARTPAVADPSAPNCSGVPQGRTIPPLDPSNSLSRAQINEQVQEQILRVVPYWSTPLAAMLEDARTFLFDDPDYFGYQAETDGTDATRGLSDAYGSCRRRYVVLITDGVPSFSDCTRVGTAGPDTEPWEADCVGYPYADAPYYAEQLHDAGVEVHVVGFNVSPESGVILNAIAAAGGTEEARFASGGRSLVYELGDILSQISIGAPSRSTPANSTRIRPGLRTGQYTFESNFEIHRGSPYWTGDVSRVSRECAGGSLGEAEEVNFSEWYDAQTNTELSTRYILTSSPRWHSCYLKNAGAETWSPFQDGDDELTQAYGVSNAEIAAACAYNDEPGTDSTADPRCEDLTDGRVGFQDRFINGSREAQCMTELNFISTLFTPHIFGADGLLPGFLGDLLTIAGAQTNLYLRWLRGWNLTELRSYNRNALEAEVPNAEPRWDSTAGEYTHDRRSRLGPIVHSSPVIVGQPDPRLEISEAYAEFADDNSDRKTVVYVATADGLLRALDADTQEELFAFLPPSVAYRIGETMQAHTELIDGTPTIADVRTHRVGADAERWKTVLVLPYRNGGRGVLALDVTDPLAPAFLWEIDAELDPQLGLTYSRPALGSVYMGDCVVGTGPCERGVAVFGGGAPPGGLDDYSTTNIGRTMYVVDIETGIVLRRFTHMYDDSGVSVPIPAPVSGDVTLYDNFTGTLSTRAFVGTLGGHMLRLDLSSPDIDEWRIDEFFDPDDHSELSDLAGVFFRPTVALTRTTGRAVVTFGTGNIDDLEAGNVKSNIVASVTELPMFDTDGTLLRVGGDLNWVLELEPEERVTARPRIFNRVAYFGTFIADSDPCAIGGARLYGLDFIGDLSHAGTVGDISEDVFVSYLTEDPYELPDDDNPYVPFHDYTTYEGLDPVVIPEESVLYAIEITERLSCFEEAEGAGNRANGQSVSVEVSDQGEYVLQIGTSSLSGETGGVDAAISQVSEMTIPDPAASIIPTSWSVIFE